MFINWQKLIIENFVFDQTTALKYGLEVSKNLMIDMRDLKSLLVLMAAYELIEFPLHHLLNLKTGDLDMTKNRFFLQKKEEPIES